MKVKIDTREKFHVITLIDPDQSANMTEELENTLMPLLNSDVKNVILSMQGIEQLDKNNAEEIIRLQQSFYDHNASFVVCCLKKELEAELDQEGILELLNFTPTESEAWDIVQMEEIERELLG